MVAAAVLAAAGAACAAEYRSVADAGVVAYDAPSAKARKLYVFGRGYPVEVMVVLEGWSKVRDATGELVWMESRQLAARRNVMVRARVAEVRQAAEDGAAVVFRADQSVLLEVLEPAAQGWIRVRHQDGESGFVRVNQVWGG